MHATRDGRRARLPRPRFDYLAIAPSGRWLVQHAHGSARVMVLDLDRAIEVATFEIASPIRHLVIVRDDVCVAIGEDGVLRAISLPDGARTWSLPAPGVGWIDVARDDRTLLAWSLTERVGRERHHDYGDEVAPWLLVDSERGEVRHAWTPDELVPPDIARDERFAPHAQLHPRGDEVAIVAERRTSEGGHAGWSRPFSLATTGATTTWPAELEGWSFGWRDERSLGGFVDVGAEYDAVFAWRTPERIVRWRVPSPDPSAPRHTVHVRPLHRDDGTLAVAIHGIDTARLVTFDPVAFDPARDAASERSTDLLAAMSAWLPAPVARGRRTGVTALRDGRLLVAVPHEGGRVTVATTDARGALRGPMQTLDVAEGEIAFPSAPHRSPWADVTPSERTDERWLFDLRE